MTLSVDAKRNLVFLSVVTTFFSGLSVASVGIYHADFGPTALLLIGAGISFYLLFYSLQIWSYDVSALTAKHIALFFLPAAVFALDAWLFWTIYELQTTENVADFFSQIDPTVLLVLAWLVLVFGLCMLLFQTVLFATLFIKAGTDYDNQQLKEDIERKSPGVTLQLPPDHQAPKHMPLREWGPAFGCLGRIMVVAGVAFFSIFSLELRAWVRDHFSTVLLLSAVFFLVVFVVGRRMAGVADNAGSQVLK